MENDKWRMENDVAPDGNERPPSLRAGHSLERAKQSRENAPRLDCFAALRLAMTALPRTTRTNTNKPVIASGPLIRVGEAIQCEGLPFVLY
ncbi:MAG: hypothetical protein LBT00_14505 [Spirochaetaceae bacterium]|nr:hypothetical protein [Spirochaetaceae bacterium]